MLNTAQLYYLPSPFGEFRWISVASCIRDCNSHKFRSEILWFVDQAHNNAGEKQRQRLYALGLLGMRSEKTLLGMESEKMNMLE
jgi:hypothetical protein